jgi:predicted DCC family thiol-disulfide oxidoreductase YuxK
MTAPSVQALTSPAGQHLVLYDGVCGLCNRLNQFVLRHDARGQFDFASLQSAVGRQQLAKFGRSPDDLSTFYLVRDYRSEAPTLLSKARAALLVVTVLGWPWNWLGVFGVLPNALLDRGYDLVARNRYRMFGRYESCLMPTAEYRKRFIDV